MDKVEELGVGARLGLGGGVLYFPRWGNGGRPGGSRRRGALVGRGVGVLGDRKGRKENSVRG